MTRSVTIQDCIKKVDRHFELSLSGNDFGFVLTFITFKKVMMLYPDEGPIISAERTLRERYRTLKEFGLLNESGRINPITWCELVKA